MSDPATVLSKYMTFRAALEGQRHDLTRRFYKAHWDSGVRRYFGVRLNDRGVILEDTQNPTALEKWRCVNTPEPTKPEET